MIPVKRLKRIAYINNAYPIFPTDLGKLQPPDGKNSIWDVTRLFYFHLRNKDGWRCKIITAKVNICYLIEMSAKCLHDRILLWIAFESHLLDKAIPFAPSGVTSPYRINHIISSLHVLECISNLLQEIGTNAFRKFIHWSVPFYPSYPSPNRTIILD